VVKRGFVVAAAGAAIVVAGMTGCSSNKACSGSTCSSGGKGTAKVTIDDKDQSITGTVGCTTTGDNTVIAISNGGTNNGYGGANGMGATLTNNGTDVQTVNLVNNGATLSYQKGNTAMGGDAKVTKDGNKYTITGHAVQPGQMPDISNPGAPMPTHPFTMEITCP
jgi:lipoprotein LpqH